jgi:hypothetical protein
MMDESAGMLDRADIVCRPRRYLVDRYPVPGIQTELPTKARRPAPAPAPEPASSST